MFSIHKIRFISLNSFLNIKNSDFFNLCALILQLLKTTTHSEWWIKMKQFKEKKGERNNGNYLPWKTESWMYIDTWLYTLQVFAKLCHFLINLHMFFKCFFGNSSHKCMIIIQYITIKKLMLTDLILSITIFKKSTLLCECKGYQLISVFWERKKTSP